MNDACSTLSTRSAPAADAPRPYLHFAEHDALGAQGEVQPAAFADVARLSSVAQHRGADLQGVRASPGQGVAPVGIGQGVVNGHAVAQHAHHHCLERKGGFGVGHAALEYVLCMKRGQEKAPQAEKKEISGRHRQKVERIGKYDDGSIVQGECPFKRSL